MGTARLLGPITGCLILVISGCGDAQRTPAAGGTSGHSEVVPVRVEPGHFSAAVDQETVIPTPAEVVQADSWPSSSNATLEVHDDFAATPPTLEELARSAFAATGRPGEVRTGPFDLKVGGMIAEVAIYVFGYADSNEARRAYANEPPDLVTPDRVARHEGPQPRTFEFLAGRRLVIADSERVWATCLRDSTTSCKWMLFWINRCDVNIEVDVLWDLDSDEDLALSEKVSHAFADAVAEKLRCEQ